MKKRFLCLVMALFILTGTAVSANSGYRYLFFATEGGSSVDFLKLPYGTKVNIDEYITEKIGYVFDGWYDSPINADNRITEITLEENTIVWAKWELANGLSEQQLELDILAREVIGNNVVFLTVDNEVSIVPVTDLWVERNARLEALMKVHNTIFN
ncbi:MAG: InlB B-repeat-containing protein [Firmicutes bacterium]|nr:InlB B-repeat-containing protein [Bacillota bacterium]